MPACTYRFPLLEVDRQCCDGARPSQFDPKPTSDALRRSRPRRTALSRPARALDFVRTVIRGDRRPETSSLLVNLSAIPDGCHLGAVGSRPDRPAADNAPETA